jgi:hypothetical protein
VGIAHPTKLVYIPKIGATPDLRSIWMAANDYNGGHSPPYETGWRRMIIMVGIAHPTKLEIHLDGGE